MEAKPKIKKESFPELKQYIQNIRLVITDKSERKIFFDDKKKKFKEFILDKNRVSAALIYFFGIAPYFTLFFYGLFTNNMDTIPRLAWQLTNWTSNTSVGLSLSFASNKNKKKPTLVNIIFPAAVNVISSTIAWIIGVPLEALIPGFILGQTAALLVRKFMHWEHKKAAAGIEIKSELCKEEEYNQIQEIATQKLT